MGYIAAIVAVVGAAVSAYGQRKQQIAQKKATRAQGAQAALENQRSRLEALRKARIQRAQLAQAGANQGTASSSTDEGAAGSVETQMESNLGFLGASQGNQITQTKASLANQQGASIVNMGNQIQQVGSAVGSIGGGGGAASSGAKLKAARSVE